MIRKAHIVALALAITACAQNQAPRDANKAPYPFAAYKLIWGTDPGFEAPNPNKLYKPGQKIRAAASDYNHDGTLAMDRVYFVGVDRRLTGPPDPGGEVFKGSLETHVRHATSASWERAKFTYWCTQPPPEPRQIVVASPNPDWKHLRSGEYYGHCDLTRE